MDILSKVKQAVQGMNMNFNQIGNSVQSFVQQNPTPNAFIGQQFQQRVAQPVQRQIQPQVQRFTNVVNKAALTQRTANTISPTAPTSPTLGRAMVTDFQPIINKATVPWMQGNPIKPEGFKINPINVGLNVLGMGAYSPQEQQYFKNVQKGKLTPQNKATGKELGNQEMLAVGMASNAPSAIKSVSELSKLAQNSLENVKTGIKEGGIERAIAEIKSGKMPPVKYRVLEDGKIALEDGRHHLEAARQLGIKNYPMENVTSHYKQDMPKKLGDLDLETQKELSRLRPEEYAAARMKEMSTQSNLPQSPLQEKGLSTAQGLSVSSPPSIPQDPIQKLIGALKEAKPIRGQQEALYAEARSKQAGALGGIQGQAGGESGFYKQLGQLKGPLPKAEFENIRKNFTQTEVDTLFNKIAQNNVISPFEKVSAQGALLKMLGQEGGSVPTKSELSLLGEVFPPELVQALQEKRPFLEKLFAEVNDALNIPRAVMATGDFSAPLRQGAFLIGRPKQFIPAFKNMFKYAFDEKAYQGLNQEIQARPTYQLMRENRLALTDMGSNLAKREETFMSSLVDKIPGIGAITKGSNRAYSGFLNKLRADTFDNIVQSAKSIGAYNSKLLQDTAKFVNSATGRGDLGMLQQAAPVLNSVFFSPRLVASRLNLLNPAYYAKLDPFVRKEALKSLFTFAGTGLTIASLAKMGGADVGVDPRSADFGKIKVGNTRYDPYAGFQQYIRLAAQLITGQKINSTTGAVMTLGEGYNAATRKDIIEQFFQNKEAPLASFITGLLEGTNGVGQPFNVTDEIKNRFVPLIIQDMQDLVKEHGLAGIPMEIPGLFGVGSQTYAQTPTDVVRARNGLDTQIRDLMKQGRTQDAKNLIDKNKNLLIQGSHMAPLQKEINKQISLKARAQKDVRLNPQQRKQISDALDKKIAALNKILDQEYAKLKGGQ